MRWAVGSTLALGLIGCGRVAFDTQAVARDGGGGSDDSADIGSDVLMTDGGLPAGLVGWFELESVSALGDRVGGYNGTCSACPTNTPGHLGGAVLFDGSTQCVTVVDSGAFDLQQITLAIWARQTTAGTQSQVAKRVLTGGSVNSWQLETDPTGSAPQSLSFTTYDGSGLNQYAVSAANLVTVNVWHHLAATYDGTTKRLYLDGTEVATMAAPALQYDAMAVTIGCDDNQPLARFFAGALDELEIYNRALSPSEIAALAAR
jgi:hypothetical protein